MSVLCEVSSCEYCEDGYCECPLCGSEANIVGGPEDWHPTSYDPDSGGDPYSIVCTGCECGMVLAFWDIDEAIKAWNNRADHSGEVNKMVWVSVKDMLPLNDKPVQVYIPELYMSVQAGFYTRYYGEDDGEWYEHWVASGKVTHWMPLPEPPKEETT